MLVGNDRVELPAGVRLRGSEVEDEVRGASWPVNETAAFVLERSGQSIDAITRALARSYGVDERQARADVASFVAWLNGLLLLNVHCSQCARRWLALALRLAPLRLLPKPRARRIPLVGARILTLVVGLAPRACLLAAAVGGTLAASGVAHPAASAVVGLAAGLGLLLHEAAHVAALGRRPAALVLQGARVYILHGHLQGLNAMIVGLAGPLLPAVIGVGVVAAAVPATAPTAALAGAPLVAHVLGVTVAGRDGRAACGL